MCNDLVWSLTAELNGTRLYELNRDLHFLVVQPRNAAFCLFFPRAYLLRTRQRGSTVVLGRPIYVTQEKEKITLRTRTICFQNPVGVFLHDWYVLHTNRPACFLCLRASPPPCLCVLHINPTRESNYDCTQIPQANRTALKLVVWEIISLLHFFFYFFSRLSSHISS